MCIGMGFRQLPDDVRHARLGCVDGGRWPAAWWPWPGEGPRVLAAAGEDGVNRREAAEHSEPVGQVRFVFPLACVFGRDRRPPGRLEGRWQG